MQRERSTIGRLRFNTWRWNEFSFADSRPQLAVNSVNDTATMIMEAVSRWHSVDVDLAIALPVAGSVQVSQGNYKNRAFHFPTEYHPAIRPQYADARLGAARKHQLC
jgi:hypothetical protein